MVLKSLIFEEPFCFLKGSFAVKRDFKNNKEMILVRTLQ